MSKLNWGRPVQEWAIGPAVLVALTASLSGMVAAQTPAQHTRRPHAAGTAKKLTPAQLQALRARRARRHHGKPRPTTQATPVPTITATPPDGTPNPVPQPPTPSAVPRPSTPRHYRGIRPQPTHVPEALSPGARQQE